MFEGSVPRVHGGVTPAPVWPGNAPSDTMLDLSTCVDAFGLFEPVQRALRAVEQTAAYRHYPDPESRLARGRLAEFAGVLPTHIDVAPGAAELVWTLTRAVLRASDVALVWKPCFSELEHAVAGVDGRLVSHWFGNESVEREVGRFFDAVARHRPNLAYLCAPTCPRGQWIPAELLRDGMRGAPQTTFVVDQSYLSLSAHATELATRFPDNVVLLRSLTKELGLPGVRVGYAVMNPALRARLQSQRPFWPVGAHAQAVLEVYLECAPALTARREQLLTSANELTRSLLGLGLSPVPEDTHYLTVNVARGLHPNDAHSVAAGLLARGIAVRDCTSFGLPDHVRVVAHPEQQRLVEVWARWAAEDERRETP